MKKNIISVIIAVAMAFGIVTGCGISAGETDTTGALNSIKKSGVLRVGTVGDYQPMSYLDPETNTYVGFDADVMITEIMEAGFYVGQDSRLAAPLIYEPFTNGQLGVLMPKGSEDLLEYVNQFLEKEKTEGRLDELSEKYIYHFIEEEQDNAA